MVKRNALAIHRWERGHKYGNVGGCGRHPNANTENPKSPHYNDQARLFASRQYKRPMLVRAQVEAQASSRIVLHR